MSKLPATEKILPTVPNGNEVKILQPSIYQVQQLPPFHKKAKATKAWKPPSVSTMSDLDPPNPRRSLFNVLFITVVILIVSVNLGALLWWHGYRISFHDGPGAFGSGNNKCKLGFPWFSVYKISRTVHTTKARQAHRCNISTKFENLLQVSSPTQRELLEYIKCYHLSPPVLLPRPSQIQSIPRIRTPQFEIQLQSALTMNDPNDEGWNEESKTRLFNDILGGKTGGFFIHSQPVAHERPYTLSLERNANWTGLVLETDPIKLLQLVSLYRNSWISNACLSSSSKGKPSMIMKEVENILQAKCYSLISYLSLLNRTSVDLLSLRHERKPWKIFEAAFNHRPTIHFGLIEIYHNPAEPADKELLKNTLTSRNYRVVGESENHFVFQSQSQNQNHHHPNIINKNPYQPEQLQERRHTHPYQHHRQSPSQNSISQSEKDGLSALLLPDPAASPRKWQRKTTLTKRKDDQKMHKIETMIEKFLSQSQSTNSVPVPENKQEREVNHVLDSNPNSAGPISSLINNKTI